MAEPAPTRFAQILAAGRGRFNALFAQARRQTPQLDPEVFAGHLRSTVAPIVEQVAIAAPAKAEEVADVLYEFSLTLVGRDLLGANSRYPAIAEGWSRLLGGLPHHLAAAPRAFAGSVTNALYQLSQIPGAQPREWIEAMDHLGRQCVDTSALLEAGKVAAWRAGLPHFRDGALTACNRLEPALAWTALGISPSQASAELPQVVERLRADPWLTPAAASAKQPKAKQLGIVAVVGDFRGFGGLFLNPPRVAYFDGQFYAADSESTWLLTADCFGATFHRTSVAWPRDRDRFATAFQLDRRRANLAKGDLRATFPQLADWATAADDASTLAVTIPFSHRIYLIAARAP